MNRSHTYSVQPKQYLGKVESFLKGLLDEVSVKEALCEENTLIDVRTSQEYKKGSIPEAFNYPLFDNLERAEIGVVFGNPETTTGGYALKFYSSIRLDVRRASQIKSGDEVKGHRMKIKVAKNKLAPPFRIAEVDLIYGVGISRMGVLIDLAFNENIVQKSGTWFSYNNDRL